MAQLRFKKYMSKYSAIGFVELLIAIGIAGIAVLVLMNMAANGMKEAIRHERLDALTRLATGGALVVRRHAENASDFQAMEREENFVKPFGGDGVAGWCYKIDFEEPEEVVFSDLDRYLPDPEELSEVAELRRTVITGYEAGISLGDEYYIAYCIESVTEGSWVSSSGQDDLEREVYIGHVIAGYVSCGNCGIEPYKSPVVVAVVRLSED